MSVETGIQKAPDPLFPDIDALQRTLRRADQHREEREKYDRRQGRLIARLISSIQGREPSDSLKDRTLRELGHKEAGYSFDDGRSLTRFVARLGNPLLRRAPLVDSLLEGMRRSLILPTFANREPESSQDLISVR